LHKFKRILRHCIFYRY